MIGIHALSKSRKRGPRLRHVIAKVVICRGFTCEDRRTAAVFTSEAPTIIAHYRMTDIKRKHSLSS
jgi:hypothetical protein